MRVLLSLRLSRLSKGELGQIDTDLAEFFAERAVVRERFGDEGPEARRVVEFAEMAEFVDDNVIGEMRRKECDVVIEIEVFLA